MSKAKRIGALVLALLLTLSMLAACSGKTSGTEPTGAAATTVAKGSDAAADTTASDAAPALDISKAVELNAILVGPEPKDMASVAAELNKLSSKDLNATVKWTFLGWDNLGNKYNLILSSGEKADLIYTATWNSYQQYAKKGAFMALDDYLPTYAPESWNGMSADAWTSTKINGKIYTVPCDWQELMSNGFAYRLDIAEKLGITKPIASFDELDAYLAACKQAYPNIIPFNASITELGGSLVDAGRGKYENSISGGRYYAVAESIDSPKVVNFLETPEFETICTVAKKFLDSGYWSKNILSNKVSADGLFLEGKSFVCKQNITQTSALYTNIIKDHPDWKIGFFGQMDVNGGILHPNVPIGNGIALPKACSDPARALAYVDKLRYDKNYYVLSNYGIQGKHFDLSPSGAAVFKGSADAIGFGYQSMQPWGWHIDKMELPVDNQWPQWKTIYDTYGPKATFDKLGAFSFDNQSVSAETAALDQIMNSEFTILVAGKSNDIKGDIQKLNDKLNKAGLAKYTAEIQKQLEEYWKTMGY